LDNAWSFSTLYTKLDGNSIHSIEKKNVTTGIPCQITWLIGSVIFTKTLKIAEMFNCGGEYEENDDVSAV